MIPLVAHAIRAAVVVAVDLVGEAIGRGVRRRRARRAELSPTCPACDDDPADRCGVCHRRRSRVEA